MSRHVIGTLTFACALPFGAVLAQDGGVRGTINVPDSGITGIVVYLVPESGAPTAPPPMKAAMDQRGLKFVPRVVAVTPGSTVTFPNSDAVLHSVFHPSMHGDAFDLGTYSKGEQRSFTFANEGAFVIFCRVHPEMIGYVVVVGAPHIAVSNDSGAFQLEGVAPGAYRLHTWHRRLRSLDEAVSVPAGGTVTLRLALKRGVPVTPRVAGGPPGK